jgi:hypothetical protein
MGAKSSLICYADGDVASVLAAQPVLDRAATGELVRRLFPGHEVTPAEDQTLAEVGIPDRGMVYAAVWPGVSLVCTDQVARDRPSELDARFLAEYPGRSVSAHAMHSVVDWFALGVWGPDGDLQRALSVSGESGAVIEDLGERLAFEEPFWAGEHPATDDEDDDSPFPFHPLELSEACLHHLFGFVLEGYDGMPDDGRVDPFDVTLAGFSVSKGSRLGRLFGRR